MIRQQAATALLCLMTLLGAVSSMAQRAPEIDYQIHMNGRFWNTVNNNGVIGNIYGGSMPHEYLTAPSFTYPNYSKVSYGNYMGLWVGGVVNGDTLVTTAIDDAGNSEFWPEYSPFGDFEVRSNIPNSPDYSYNARAEIEFRTVYTDTFDNEGFVPYSTYDYRRHQPLNIAVVQTSYSWSTSYAADFVLLDYKIVNLSPDTIYDAWVGMYYNGLIWHRGEATFLIPDETEGYLYSAPYEFEGLDDELLRIAWTADHDGQVANFPWRMLNNPHALGVAPLRTPRGAYRNNFNWWTRGRNYSWGPRMEGTVEYPFRSFPVGLGVPLSDRNRYYLMSKPEIDYSGLEAAVDHRKEGWLGRSRYSREIAKGHSVEFLTSFGPFDLRPGESDTLTVVLAIGTNIHSDANGWDKLHDIYDPYPFMDYLRFDDLVSSVRWARMIYDNPGLDTDGDGDSGKAVWYHNEDLGDSVRVFYEGDGVPDFRGATPPPPPQLRITPEKNRLVIRWNGQVTETALDPMTFAQDFEGYRVYLSRSRSGQEAMLLSSWDRETFNRHHWNDTRRSWENMDLPFTRDSLEAIYGLGFEPADYPYEEPLVWRGGLYYFKDVDYNLSDLSNPQGIHRLYPDAILDSSDVDEEGRLRYYEYEYIIEDLLPTVPYYVTVTAFDYGHPPRKLEPLESQIEPYLVEAFAASQGDDTRPEGKLAVYCYPNPYRIDGGYYPGGWENRLDEYAPERARNVWFANLPNKCTITIYSLDGDLIRRLDHDEPAGGGRASIHRWDMISRNTEALVSGLYYWVVESEYGDQIGKLAIIK